MNRRGTPANLVAAHPGNHNATRYGVYSDRLIHSHASVIEQQLVGQLDLTAVERVPFYEAACLMARNDAIDRDFDERGLVDKSGRPRDLLNVRLRNSRQLERWLEKCSAIIARHAAPDLSSLDRFTYIRKLQEFAYGHAESLNSHDQFLALQELGKLGGAAFVSSPNALLPPTGAIADSMLAARLTAGDAERLRRMLVATREDGTPDYSERAAGEDALRSLCLWYPAMEKALDPTSRDEGGGTRPTKAQMSEETAAD